MNTKANPTRLGKRSKRVLFQCLCLMLCLSGTTVSAFAAQATDPVAAVSNFSNLLFSIIRAVGIIIAGWGIVQVGLSMQTHDASQRSNGVLCVLGGIIIIFTKEIINVITG